MSSISSAWSITTGALNADQAALNVVSNNVANANTTGYVRQTATFSENGSVSSDGVSYGAGTTMTGAESQRSLILELQVQQQTQITEDSSARLTALQDVQSIFSTSTDTSTDGTDIGSYITSFFNSFTSLAASPDSDSLRQDVLTAANELAGSVQSAAEQLSSEQQNLNSQVSSVVDQVNSLLSTIASLNQQIQSISSSGQDAGVLEDQRQLALTSLSSFIGFQVTKTENNGITLTTDSGAILVSKSQAYPLSTTTVDGLTHILSSGGDDITSALEGSGGQLGGILTVRDEDIPAVMSKLDELAYDISTQVNTLNANGTDADEDDGTAGDIFHQPSAVAGAALSMSVVMTDPDKIAAAALGGSEGDGTNATSMAALATSSIVDGQEPTTYYSNIISALGSLVTQVDGTYTAQSTTLATLTSTRDSLSAVSLDEEASNLTLFERSYQSASKLFTVLDSIFESAINLGTGTSV